MKLAFIVHVEPHGPQRGREPLRRTMLLLTQRYIGQFLID